MKPHHTARLTPSRSPACPIVRWVALLGLGLVILLTACQRKPGASPEADASGVYTLVSVDGKQLPAAIDHDGVALRVVAGTMTLSTDRTCVSKITFAPPSGDEIVREVSATFVREGPQLKLQWQGAGRTTGTLEGNEFTMNNEGTVFTYRK